MNTLSDTLRDLIGDANTLDKFIGLPDHGERFEKEMDLLVEEYVERIKNELNVEKYLQ